ncbi:MAG: sulfotransferase family 2 domain-containing protein [Pseudomonadota bacterium]
MRYVASRTRPIIYLPIAKAGLTSTLNAMLWLDTGESLEDPLSIHRRSAELFITSRLHPEALKARFETDKVFTIVRDPLRRAFSLFNEKAVADHEHAFPFLKRRLRKNGASLKPDDDLARRTEDFVIFLRYVGFQARKHRRAPENINPHWRPQSMVLRRAQNARTPDFVCRTETLSEDFPAFLRWAGVEDQPPSRRFNEGPTPTHALSEVAADPRIHALARRIFAKDYATLGYALPGLDAGA